MTLNPALAKPLLLAAVVAMALPLWADTPQKSTTGKVTPTPTPSVSNSGAAAEKEKKPPIPGVVVTRARGGFLGLNVENGNFKLSFYDGKKKPTEVDVARAGIRWRAVGILNEQHAVLNTAPDNLALIGNHFVKPPYTFKAYLTLLADNNTAIENYVIDLTPLSGG